MFIAQLDDDGTEVPCVKIPLKKPNHGSMVSSFVHWLKDADFEVLSIEMPDHAQGPAR